MSSTVPKFLEEFALHTNVAERQSLLKKLVPGSKDAFYYQSLVLLQKLESVVQEKNIDLNNVPIKLNDEETELYEETKKKITESPDKNYEDVEAQLKMRFYLLSYPIDPVATCKFLIHKFGIESNSLSLNDELLLEHGTLEDTEAAEAQYPSELDPNQFSKDKLISMIQDVHLGSLRNNGDPFEAIALPFLYQVPIQSDYDDYLVVQYILQNAQNAPIRLPGFVKRLAKVIAKRNSQRKKDEQMYHRLDLSAMTLDQLSELAEALPEILEDANFIELYLTKLQPASDQLAEPAIDQFTPDEVVLDYLGKALTFLGKVPYGAEHWKRTAMHKKLLLNMYKGNFDCNMFLEYLRLPRQRSMNGLFDGKFGYDKARRPPDFNLLSQYRAKPFLLAAPEVDENTLITEYLRALFIQGVPKSAFQGILDSQSYLDPTYAETMFTAGKLKPNECINILGQSRFETLVERQDFEFTPTSKRSKIWYPNDAVTISLRLKNVKDLSIRVFRINMYSYYRENPKLQNVDANIDLDGLTPIWESYKTKDQRLPNEQYEEAFTFGGEGGLAIKEFVGRGLWVIDFISGRKSCRALIQKGFINCIVRPTLSGQLLTITDEDNVRITNPYTVWLNGKERDSDPEGNVKIPFSDQQRNNTILVKLENFAQISEQPSVIEDYEFNASFYVNHECLQKENTAYVTVVPFLKVGGQRVPVSLLEDMTLSVKSKDTFNIESSYKLADVEFTDNQPFVSQFRVPSDLLSLQFKLEGKVKRCSGGEKYQSIAAYHIVDIDRSDHNCISAYVRTNESGYTLYVTGKNGEPKRNTAVYFELKHKFLTANIPITLKTNERGEIHLGHLSNITGIVLPQVGSNIEVKKNEQVNFWPTDIFECEGTTIKLPFYSGEDYILALGKIGVDSALLEDYTDNLQIDKGFIKIGGLTPGRYKLRCVTTSHVQAVEIFIIRGVQEAPKDHLWANLKLGNRWIIESAGDAIFQPLTISDVHINENTISVQLQNWTSKTYAILCGNSTLSHRTTQHFFMPKKSNRYSLIYPVGYGKGTSLYVSGRKLSEEYQYILERARFGKWTSTTLQNPSLLVKRQQQAETTVTSKKLKSATAYKSAENLLARNLHSVLTRGERLNIFNSPARFDSILPYDYLRISNFRTQVVKPNADGAILIDKEALGTSNCLSILVISGDQAVARDVVLFRDLAIPNVDLRHFAPIDPSKAIIRAREVTKLEVANEPVEVCVAQDREVVDSFEKLYSIFKTLRTSEELETFNFLNTWPSLDNHKKLELYDKHACHELNFWIMHKDKKFFKEVVHVAIKSKLEKTFLDLYMLGADVSIFETDLHHFESLNLFEKVLLAKRNPNIHDTVKALISEPIEFTPPESSTLQMQFDTVLAGASMNIDRATADQPMPVMVAMQSALAPPPAPQLFGSAGAVPTSRSMFVANNSASTYAAPGFGMAPPPPPAMSRMAVQHKSLQDNDDDTHDSLETETSLGESDEEDRALMELRTTMDTEHTYQYKESTREYRETNYLLQDTFIATHGFWLDYLVHDGSGPFLSEQFAQASNSFAEQMLALAVIDVPFKADAKITSQFVPENNQIKVTAFSPALVFHRSLRLCEVSSNQDKLLVVQNIFSTTDQDQQGKRKLVPCNDLRNSVEYGMHIVISNMTAESYVIEASYQIPIGSVPTRKSRYLDATTIYIEPYTTWQEETSFFYFPEDGSYTNVPVSVTIGGDLVARSKFTDIIVKQSVQQAGDKDWRSIATHGSSADIVSYLKTANLLKTDLKLIHQKMNNRAFANDAINVLRNRKYYDYDLWVQGIRHNLPLAIRDVLTMEQYHLDTVGRHFTSVLVNLPKTSSNYLQILDYNPIVKARAHSVGADNSILNTGFHQQYVRFLEYLSQKREHNATDLLCLAVYLVYQERLVEANAVRQKLKDIGGQGQSVMDTVQYDYVDAFLNTRVPCDSLDSCDQLLESTRDLAMKYKDYPVLSWRQRFEDIINIFNEMDGISNTFDTDKQQFTVEQLNVKELNQGPSLDLNVSDSEVLVSYANIRTVKLKIYALNIEMLFSTNPFISKNSSGNYSLVAANYEKEYNVDDCPQAAPKDTVHSRAANDEFEIVGTIKQRVNTIKLEIPAELQNKNILVEVQGGGIIQSSAHFSNALNVQAVESSGLLRVASIKSGRPSAGAYVKVYVKLFSGKVHFWKDGYTAINGVFDYISATEDNELVGADRSSLKEIMAKVQKMSILVLSSESGGLIKVVEPPK